MAADYPIGHVFKYDNVKLKVLRTENGQDCKWCYFEGKPYYNCPNISCNPMRRKDNNNVSFVETDEPLTEE